MLEAAALSTEPQPCSAYDVVQFPRCALIGFNLPVDSVLALRRRCRRRVGVVGAVKVISKA